MLETETKHEEIENHVVNNQQSEQLKLHIYPAFQREIPYRQVGNNIRTPFGLEEYSLAFIDSSLGMLKPLLQHGIPQIDIQVAQMLDPKNSPEEPLAIVRNPLNSYGYTNLKDGGVTVYIPIRDVSEAPLQGIENQIRMVLEDNDLAYLDFITIFENWPNKDLPFGGIFDPATVLTLVMSGESDQLLSLIPFSKSRLQKVLANVSPWLNKYITLTDNEKLLYEAVLSHELHHSEFQSRAIDKGIFRSRSDMNLFSEILNYYDSNLRVELQYSEIQKLSNMLKQDPIGFHRYNSKMYQTILQAMVQSDSLYEELLKYAVFYGCDETIATLMTQSLSLRTTHYYRPVDVITNYSPVSLILPPLEFIEKWQEELTVEPHNIAAALDNVYNNLLDEGQFKYLFQQALNKYGKMKGKFKVNYQE